ncbi:GNAT family N-acetyltransferase [Kitasatospora sp. NPDC088134]|uniref:GNAT family N-acetyltransferase n=1 Tax=Kitasatospora sp. NPDC088134 TaxID=3364071 RepID=UPI0038188C76
MTTGTDGWRLRAADGRDGAELLRLWGLLFAERDGEPEVWRRHAAEWFARAVADRSVACFPVIEAADGTIVATAVGTLELGVPNPYCTTGRTVRLANVITLPGHRGRGHGTALVRAVLAWAESVAADRVDLSATPDGLRLYARLGFTPTSAPRMKFVLPTAP